MIRNIGKLDAGIRMSLGLVLLGVGAMADGPWKWLMLPGAVLPLTAVVGFCPAYWLARISTRAARAGD